MWPLHWIPADADGQPAMLLFLPPSPPKGLLICVHGYTRQPLEQAQAFWPLALARGWALVLPVFDEQRHRRYAQLRPSKRGLRADLGLIACIESLVVSHQLPASGWHLFGYSAGAQFAHRFAMLHPERLQALALGAAGWYTWPDPERAWPLGVARAEQLGAARLEAFLSLPTQLWVGERDDAPDEHLREDEALNAWQGVGRLERARRWQAAFAQAAAQRALPHRPGLHTIPGAGHSFVACQRKGQLAQAVMAFFDASAGA